MVTIAQLVRALDCGSRGRRFDPDQSPKKLNIFLELVKLTDIVKYNKYNK